MPSSYGYTYVVISLAVVAVGMCCGLWCSNNSTTPKKTTQPLNGSHDSTSTLARLKKVKTNLELKVKQLQEDYVTLERKLESARMTLEKDRDPEEQLCSKPLKLQISSVCEIEVKDFYDPRQIAYGALLAPSQSLQPNFPKDSATDGELKQDHSTEHFETSAAVSEAVDLEPVSLLIEPNEGIGIGKDIQDGMVLLVHKQLLSEESTHKKDQVTENKVRKLLQENKEYENQKSLLNKEIQELQLLKTKLEDQVRQLKGKRKEMRAGSLRGEIMVNFPKESITQNSGYNRSVSVDQRNDHESLHERLKHLREKSLSRKTKNATTGHLLSLSTSNLIKEEPSETQKPLFFSEKKSQSLSSRMEEKSRPGTIDELSSAIDFNSNAGVILEGNEDQSDSLDGSEWNVSSMFLT